MTQKVSGIEDNQLYSFSFEVTGDALFAQALEAYVVLTDGKLVYNIELFDFGPNVFLPPYHRFEGHFKLQRKNTAPVELAVVFVVQQEISVLAIDNVQLVKGGHVVGDPVFSGFHAQLFRVTGIPDRIFNVLSLPALQVNSRFVSLVDGQSMSAAEMKTIRSLMEITGAATARSSSLFVPPPTTAYNHPGTYLGSAGVKVSGHRLYVQAGDYRLGFANASLDGAELPVSSAVLVLADGSQLHRPSPFSLSITTQQLSFTLVNADHFLNIESAALLQPFAHLKQADCAIAGLLGQTADPEWQVEKTEDFKRHLELDHLLAGQDIFGDDFPTNLFQQ
jgi:hypothetical protein